MIREATKEDRQEFIRMTREYLKEFSQTTANVSMDDMGFYLGLFRGYTEGSLFGETFFYYAEKDSRTPLGVCLAGEPADGILEDSGAPQSKYGKTAVCWVIWTDPTVRHSGAAFELITHALKRATELGFKTAMFEVPYDTEIIRKHREIYGMHPSTVRYYVPIPEVP